MLEVTLRAALKDAVAAYDFPSITYDFAGSRETAHPSMSQLEDCVRESLLSSDLGKVKDGLSNVLYWGYYRMGIRDVRVNRFRDQINDVQLAAARDLFHHLRGPGLREIHHLGLPEFSAISFISKIRMFLDPSQYVTLDLKLLKLRHEQQRNIFHDAHMSARATSIPVTMANESLYKRWCNLCRTIARQEFSGENVRAVDVERAIFQLIDKGRAKLAVDILNGAVRS